MIPNEVQLKGTFRTMDENWRRDALQKIKHTAEGIAAALGASANLRIVSGYPFLHNDPPLTHALRTRAEHYMGSENVVDLPLRMSSEDFAFYSQVIPACFYRLGTGNASKGITAPVHTQTFDVDEDCLLYSTGLMAWLALGD
ncbi:MAG: M20/M25/M40 family metallo-hydrolase [Saprospiraceae bacterium]